MGSHKGKCAIENRLYILGLVFFLAFTGIVIILKLVLPEDFQIRTCTFFKATGYYCPGCGGTRAVICLIDGHLLDSLIYHPLIIYLSGIYAVFMISHTIEKIGDCYNKSKGREKILPIHGLKFRPWYLYVALIIVFINVTLKNVLIYTGLWHD